MKNKILEYSFEVQKALSSNSWNVIIRDEAISFDCDCGTKIVHRKESISENSIFKCSECPKQYDFYSDSAGKSTIKLRQIVWECNFCQEKNAFPEYQLADRYLVKCRCCSEPAQIRKEWMFFQNTEKVEQENNELG